MEKLDSVKTSKDGKVDVNIPSDDKDLDAQYEAEMAVLATKFEPPKKTVNKEEAQVDYYKGVRSGVVLVWIFSNFALSAAVLNSGGLERVTLEPGEDAQAEQARRNIIYLSIVLWSVAGLSAFRFLGATWFLILRLVCIYVDGKCRLANRLGVVPWCINSLWTSSILGL